MTEVQKKNDDGPPSVLGMTNSKEGDELHGNNPLFKLSVSDYLEESIATVLAHALEDLCRIRPANPVDYLALYLLRRSQAQNVVEIPYSEAVPKMGTERPS